VAVVVAAVVVAVLVAGVSGRGADLRTSADLPKKIQKITYTDDSTEICLMSGTNIPDPASETVTMVIKIGTEEDDFKMTTKADNCGIFPNALKPANDDEVEYSVFFDNSGTTEGEIQAHAAFTFEEKSGIETLSCGSQAFERSLRADEPNAETDCLNKDTNSAHCYKLASQPAPSGGDGCSDVDVNGFQYCQKAASELTQNDEIAYVNSLSYGGEITLEQPPSPAVQLSEVSDVIVVQDVAGVTADPQVLSYTPSTPVTLDPFTRGATGGTYTVCAVTATEYSESSIDDINIIGKYAAEYYQFGFKYPVGSPETYKAESDANPVTIDCSALTAGDDTRCYGYLEEPVDTNDLTVSFDVDASGTTRKLSIIVKSTELEV